MDQKQIEKLMKAMEESRIKRVVLKQEGFEIEIERECYVHAPVHHPVPPPPPYPEPKPKTIVEAHPTVEAVPRTGTFVTSPMVGTFYASPSPDDPPFVKVGDSVSENTLVCIIEAMKVMNEVKSGLKGTVAEVLMHNGDPVEFGTRILRIDPS